MRQIGTIVIAALALAACHRGGGAAPTGQVLANVNGHEITKADLTSEIGDLPSSATPQQRTAVERAALEQIIARQILADHAVEKKLDQSPLAAVMRRRAEQQALVELLTRNLRATAPAPSREEAQQFVTDHPSSFAQRKIFLVDQFIVRNPPPAVVEAMKPIETLDGIAELLGREHVNYTKTAGVLDALTIDADAAERIAALKPGAVFVSPEGPLVRVNRIRETQIQPVTGDEAVKVALEVLRARRTNQLLGNQMKQIVVEGMKKVKFNPAITARPGAAPGATPKP